jgi:hypothetical protein
VRSVAWLWAALTRPLAAWMLHFAALWLWHVPALFQRGLANKGVHALQHASFLFTALLFWWAVLGKQGLYGARRLHHLPVHDHDAHRRTGRAVHDVGDGLVPGVWRCRGGFRPVPARGPATGRLDHVDTGRAGARGGGAGAVRRLADCGAAVADVATMRGAER